MIFASTIVPENGRKWIRVTFQYSTLHLEQMQSVKNAFWYAEQKCWAVPYDSLLDFEEKMGDFLIVWEGEDGSTKGGIDENSLPLQPTVAGYSVVYDADGKIVGSTGFRTQPWGEFQVRGFNAMVERPFLILADDAGLGKSFQVGTAMEARKRKGEVRRGLVVAKASLLYNWRDEIHKHTFQKAVVIDGTQKKRHKTYSDLATKNDWTFAIVSYETFRDDIQIMQWLDNMQSLDFCILDEAHKIKNSNSGMGDAIHAIPFRYRYVLTATPLINSPLEAFNFLKFGKMLPDEISGWLDFRSRYAVMGGFGGKEVTAYQNIKELKALIQMNMLRRLKKDKLKELPDVTFNKIMIPMNTGQQKLYKAIVDSIMDDLKHTVLEKIEGALAKLIRLQQVANAPILIGDEKTKSSKLEALDDLVENLILGGEKVIVFSKFSTMVDLIQQRYAKFNPAIITGDVSSSGRSESHAIKSLRRTVPGFADLPVAQRDKLIDDFTSSERMKEVYKFQNDRSCKLFLGTSGSCREGLTLTAATHVIFIDCEWSPSYVMQAFSRAHRIGQKDAVTVHYLICEDTVDVHVQKILDRKEAIAQAMLDKGIESVGVIRAREAIATLVGAA